MFVAQDGGFPFSVFKSQTKVGFFQARVTRTKPPDLVTAVFIERLLIS